jgi:hypothetical protein
MPRVNSQNWAVNEKITSARLQDVNEDIDDIYANGDDRGRVVLAASLAALKVDVAPFVYIVSGTPGTHAGVTDLSVTNNATNYVEVNSAGTISVNTSGWTASSARLAIVVASGGAITSITQQRTTIVGGTFGSVTYEYLEARTLKAGAAIDYQIMTASTTFYTDDQNFLVYRSGTIITVRNKTGGNIENRNLTSDWADADAIGGVAKVGAYLYILLEDTGTTPDSFRVYRYDATNISAGGTLMTASFLGSTDSAMVMTSDGTDMFFTYNGGKSFGDATTQYDITEPVTGTFRYTYDGTGTAPLFVTNGMATGQVINIAGFTNANNNGNMTVTAVAETYFEITNAVGSEIVTNGNFSASSNWEFDTNWAYDGTNFEADATGVTTGFLSDNNSVLTGGVQYITAFEVKNYSTGNVRVRLNSKVSGGADGTVRSSNGTYTEVISCGSSSPMKVRFYYGGSNFTGSIDNVSVKYAGGIVESNKTGITVSYADLAIRKATISGTTLTGSSVIFCGSTSGYFDYFAVSTSQIIAKDGTTPYYLRKFNKSTGALEYTSEYGISSSIINVKDLILETSAGGQFYHYAQ